jgi:hypothetical protein
VRSLRLSALVLLLTLAAAGCGSDDGGDPWLPALRKERVAAIVPPGGKLVLTSETAPHSALGKPVTAHILRVFAYSDLDAARGGRDAVAEEARSSGWRVNANPLHPGGPLWGAKRLSAGDATLSIGEYASSEGARVSVRIEQGECARQLCVA